MRSLYGDNTISVNNSSFNNTSDSARREKKKKLKTQTIHGIFGVVNVPPEEYDERLNQVLNAFQQ